jgi:DNA-binding transcriptional ArsR family regulator
MPSTADPGDHGTETGQSAGDPTDEAFRALADRTRRHMLDLLAEHGEMSVGDLAAEFPDLVTSGISKHLMTLRASGLVLVRNVGRQRIYRVDGDGLRRALTPWLHRYEAYWDRSLVTLRDLAENRPMDRRTTGHAPSDGSD